MAINSYRRETYTPVLDVDSPEFMKRELIKVGKLRYGRRGEDNYYANIALFDSELLEYHNKEYFSVKGRSYNQVISYLYDKIFNQ